MNFAEAWNDTCSLVGRVARVGNIEELRRLIGHRCPVDVADNRGWRPLHEAAAYKSHSVSCLEELLKHDKTDPNWKTHEGETALLLASKRRIGQGALAAVRVLLRRGADANLADNEDETPLLAAVRSKLPIEVIELLIRKGHANVNVMDCSLWTPLHEAATQGNVQLVQLLLTANADIGALDECRITPIFTAAQHGQLECLRILVEEAKKRGKTTLIDQGAEDDATPLMIAAQQGFLDCIHFLLEAGANPYLWTKDQVTAVHLAVQGKHPQVLELLLGKITMDCFVQCSIKMEDSINPLILAVRNDSLDCLRILLDAGFPVDFPATLTELYLTGVTMPQHQTTLCFAVSSHNHEAMELLLNYGAKCVPDNRESLIPLVPAIFNPSTRELELLLRHGVDLNPYPDFTAACLLSALRVSGGRLALVLHAGADPMSCLFTDNLLGALFSHQGAVDRLESQRNVLAKLRLLLAYGYHNSKMAAFIRLSYHCASRRLQEVLDESQWTDLLESVSAPSSLLHLCRHHLRRHFCSLYRSKLNDHIPLLQIPTSLISFLLHEDDEAILSSFLRSPPAPSTRA